MVNSKTFPHTKPSANKVAQVLPETVVLASKQGTWRGIEVVQRRHTVSDHDFPPLSFLKYKLLGKSGLRVSELCLGTMTFGDDWG